MYLIFLVLAPQVDSGFQQQQGYREVRKGGDRSNRDLDLAVTIRTDAGTRGNSYIDAGDRKSFDQPRFVNKNVWLSKYLSIMNEHYNALPLYFVRLILFFFIYSWV